MEGRDLVTDGYRRVTGPGPGRSTVAWPGPLYCLCGCQPAKEDRKYCKPACFMI